LPQAITPVTHCILAVEMVASELEIRYVSGSSGFRFEENSE